MCWRSTGASGRARCASSNAGHVLFTGIASRERARRTAATLMDERHFSGWGIRTVADSEARYNPMSYHNGSVWPHDNALIAAGFARYHLHDFVRRAFEGMFAASQFVELHRLPELFCGFPRRPGEGPTLYPIACAPQAWAAGSLFLMLQACLGLEIDGARQEVAFRHPVLPEALPGVAHHQPRCRRRLGRSADRESPARRRRHRAPPARPGQRDRRQVTAVSAGERPAARGRPGAPRARRRSGPRAGSGRRRRRIRPAPGGKRRRAWPAAGACG